MPNKRVALLRLTSSWHPGPALFSTMALSRFMTSSVLSHQFIVQGLLYIYIERQYHKKRGLFCVLGPQEHFWFHKNFVTE